MRLRQAFFLAAGLWSFTAVYAQAPGAPGTGARPDFSGVYAIGVFATGGAIDLPDRYPFTPEGERAHEAYDPLISDIRQTNDCAPEPMPEILWSGNPIEIIQERDAIQIRYEDADTRRSIAMGAPPVAADQARTRLGHSRGRWEGETLIVETTHMTSGVIFSNRGYPISPSARITERYQREQTGNDLRLEIVVDDPVNYTEPFSYGRRLVGSPDEQVRPWECVSLGPRDSEPPDMDELARMLEDL